MHLEYSKKKFISGLPTRLTPKITPTYRNISILFITKYISIVKYLGMICLIRRFKYILGLCI